MTNPNEYMNLELLAKVRDRIEAEAEHFDMSDWFVHNFDENGNQDHSHDLPFDPETGNLHCGTTACIAGMVATVLKVKLKPRSWSLVDGPSYNHVADVAHEALGLHHRALFHVGSWPEHFQDLAYNDDDDDDYGHRAEAKAAVALINAIIEGRVIESDPDDDEQRLIEVS
jgi:hypothetical protein